MCRHTDAIQTLHENRLLQTEAQADDFIAAMDVVTSDFDLACLPSLLRVFDDRAAIVGPMQHLRSAIVRLDPQDLLPALIDASSTMIATNPRWLGELFLGFAANNARRDYLKAFLTHATKQEKHAVRSVIMLYSRWELGDRDEEAEMRREVEEILSVLG